MPYKEQGYITISAPGDYLIEEKSTWNCCHCQRIVHTVPGSGKQRGYCFNCDKPHCGEKDCWDCRPFEAWLDWKEETRLLRRYPGLPILGVN